MRFMMVLFISFLLPFCSTKQKEHVDIQIVIEEAQSYKYDLVNEVFTVFYESKPETKIKFHLSDEEREKIIAEYYALKIDAMNEADTAIGKIYIVDECMVMPQIFTLLHIKTTSKTQIIQIDEGCDDFYFYNFRKAARIKKFLGIIYAILSAKPQLKNTPQSNIMYL